ncbi:hypothetical protein JCM18904_1552 [Vibrio sp. JCM 18904]|nr:hypothetical protein JCM18904_1552 [Vibrio sp. JCM 18904]
MTCQTNGYHVVLFAFSKIKLTPPKTIQEIKQFGGVSCQNKAPEFYSSPGAMQGV